MPPLWQRESVSQAPASAASRGAPRLVVARGSTLKTSSAAALCASPCRRGDRGAARATRGGRPSSAAPVRLAASSRAVPIPRAARGHRGRAASAAARKVLAVGPHFDPLDRCAFTSAAASVPSVAPPTSVLRRLRPLVVAPRAAARGGAAPSGCGAARRLPWPPRAAAALGCFTPPPLDRSLVGILVARGAAAAALRRLDSDVAAWRRRAVTARPSLPVAHLPADLCPRVAAGTNSTATSRSMRSTNAAAGRRRRHPRLHRRRRRLPPCVGARSRRHRACPRTPPRPESKSPCSRSFRSCRLWKERSRRKDSDATGGRGPAPAVV